MLNTLRSLLRPKTVPTRALPAGQRVYAIGDIHGRLDLFEVLVAAIEEDDAARGPAQTTVILLGDLIDRGADSAGVVRAARDWQARRKVRIIGGNHEELLFGALDNEDILKVFLRHGGRETVLSYGVDAEAYEAASYAEVQAMMRAAIPEEDLAFMRSFEESVRIGDYLFVHAGIMPNTPFERQRPGDLRWIREPFLGFPGDHGFTVVHGHSIAEEPELKNNRIGIDTGAYYSGRLTALALEGTERWLVATLEAEDGAVRALTRSTA
jgi:serine/threonine protein phosphatase 1